MAKSIEKTKLYTITEVARILRCSRYTLYSHIRRGHLHFAKLGGEYRITEEELQKMIKEGYGGNE